MTKFWTWLQNHNQLLSSFNRVSDYQSLIGYQFLFLKYVGKNILNNQLYLSGLVQISILMYHPTIYKFIKFNFQKCVFVSLVFYPWTSLKLKEMDRLKWNSTCTKLFMFMDIRKFTLKLII